MLRGQLNNSTETEDNKSDEHTPFASNRFNQTRGAKWHRRQHRANRKSSDNQRFLPRRNGIAVSKLFFEIFEAKNRTDISNFVTEEKSAAQAQLRLSTEALKRKADDEHRRPDKRKRRAAAAAAIEQQRAIVAAPPPPTFAEENDVLSTLLEGGDVLWDNGDDVLWDNGDDDGDVFDNGFEMWINGVE